MAKAADIQVAADRPDVRKKGGKVFVRSEASSEDRLRRRVLLQSPTEIQLDSPKP